MPDPSRANYRSGGTVRVYAEFWVRALTSIAKHHWHRHHPTKSS